jgi:uncharacterized protein (TIGR02147 family)
MKLFESKSYKSYLDGRIRAQPRNGRGESKRIAEALGVSSTLVSQILSGDRILTLEQGEALCEYWGLLPIERDYFLLLIQFERAGTSGLRSYFKDKLDLIKSESLVVANRIQPKRVLNETEKAVFYSSPLYSAIRLFTSTSKNGRSLEEIANRFEIGRKRAAEVIGFLESANLILEEDGRYKMGAQSTHLENRSPHINKHHANWRVKGMNYADQLTEAELMFTSPVSLSVDDFGLLRERMVEFINEFLSTTRDSPAEEVACFNMDFFWVRK